MNFASKIVSLVIVLNILFTIAVLIVFAIVKTEPVALIGAFFAFTTGELLALSSIKKTKIKNGVKNENTTETNE